MSSVLVLLVNLGTPDSPEPHSVRAFLSEFLTDPLVVDLPGWLWRPILHGMVLRSRPAKVARLYESIWYRQPCGDVCPGAGCSPLSCGTRRVAAALRQELGSGFRVDWAYRYGQRSIRRALSQVAVQEADRIFVVPLFPQRTCSTSGSIIEETRCVAAAFGLADRVQIVQIPPDEPGYVKALAGRCRTALERLPEPPGHLLISFHGIPRRYDRREGGRYSDDCLRTALGLVQELDWDPPTATLCYQSKFGPEPWLTPATADRIQELAVQGIRQLAVVTPGFLTEGLETLEEIGQRGQETFVQSGGDRLVCLPAVEDDASFVRGLSRLIHERLETEGVERSAERERAPTASRSLERAP